jgi:hypothetical protein
MAASANCVLSLGAWDAIGVAYGTVDANPEKEGSTDPAPRLP